MESLKSSSVSAILAWFTIPISANSPHDDFIREEILNYAYQFNRFGIDGESILLRTDEGRILLQKQIVQGCKLVWFDFVRKGARERKRFWMNESSVEDLLHKIKSAPWLQDDFGIIMAND